MTGDGSDIGVERLRILRAARDGRLKVNEYGRYVIDGERRPDRRIREQLQQQEEISFPYRRDDRRVRLLPDGRSDLEQLGCMV